MGRQRDVARAGRSFRARSRPVRARGRQRRSGGASRSCVPKPASCKHAADGVGPLAKPPKPGFEELLARLTVDGLATAVRLHQIVIGACLGACASTQPIPHDRAETSMPTAGRQTGYGRVFDQPEWTHHVGAGLAALGAILLIPASTCWLSQYSSGNHIGVRSVASFRQFSMPPAVFIFIFDLSSVAGDVLFGGDQLGGCQGCGLGGKRLREYVVELICPASVVSDDSVMDFDHDVCLSAGFGGSRFGARMRICKPAPSWRGLVAFAPGSG